MRCVLLRCFLSSLPLLWTAWSHGSLRADRVQRKDESTSDSELRLLLFSITVMQLTQLLSPLTVSYLRESLRQPWRPTEDDSGDDQLVIILSTSISFADVAFLPSQWFSRKEVAC